MPGHEVVGELVGHVQPPAVRAGPEPPADHRVLPAEDELPVGGVVLVHGGQGVDAPPALVLVGPLIEVVPGVVGGVLALVGPQLRVEAVPVEIAAHKAGVVEHPVQHHPHPRLVGLSAQAGEVLLGAQHGVDGAVVGGAVPVVLRRLKDGAEVQGAHPQAVEVVQLFLHPLQAAPEEVPVADLPAVVGAVLRLVLPGGVDPPPPHHPLGVGDPETAEPVGEDLIGHPLPKPGGDRLAAVVHRELEGAQLLPLFAVQPLQGEGVPHQAHIVHGIQHAGEHVPVPVQAGPGHGDLRRLIRPELKAGGQAGPGVALRPRRAQRQRHLGPRGHRPVGVLIPGVPGVKNGWSCHGITLVSRSSSGRPAGRPGGWLRSSGSCRRR